MDGAPVDGRPSPTARRTEAQARVRAAIATAYARHAESRSLVAQAAELIAAARRGRLDAQAPRSQQRATLRASVADYVGVLRADGLRAEQVVVLVKGIVRDSTPTEMDVREARDLMDEVVRWSIEAYYA